jgi:homospermidine synthase
MPGDRAAGGVFLWLPFFAQAKKVTRSPAGRVEALLLTNEGMNVRQRSWIPAFAGMTSQEADAMMGKKSRGGESADSTFPQRG